jgi:uncharacterized protein HemX
MNTTQNTQKKLVAAALAAALGIGMVGCAGPRDTQGLTHWQAELTDAEARAHRLASEIAHEVERAEHHVQAGKAPAATQPPLNTFDQVERRLRLDR